MLQILTIAILCFAAGCLTEDIQLASIDAGLASTVSPNSFELPVSSVPQQFAWIPKRSKSMQIVIPSSFDKKKVDKITVFRGHYNTNITYNDLIVDTMKERNYTLFSKFSNAADLTWVRIGMPFLKDRDFPVHKYRSLPVTSRVNRFPFIGRELNRKDTFAAHYLAMQEKYGRTEFDFHPDSYMIPKDVERFLADVKMYQTAKWIMKPGYGGQGRGITLLPQLDEADLRAMLLLPKNADYLVQRYIPNPLLINGTKFTVRLYVVVTSLDPLRVYLHRNGVVKFCAAPYNANEFDNAHAHMHITNEAFNKHHPQFHVSHDLDVDDTGSRWSLQALRRYVVREFGAAADAKLWDDTRAAVVKAILSVRDPLLKFADQMAPNHRLQCFQLLGVDVDIDDTLRPWYIEANVNPSLGGSTAEFDNVNKQLLMREVFDLVKAVAFNSTAYDEALRKRLELWLRSTGLEIKANKKADSAMALRTLADAVYENRHSGDFERVFPLIDAPDRFWSLLTATKLDIVQKELYAVLRDRFGTDIADPLQPRQGSSQSVGENPIQHDEL